MMVLSLLPLTREPQKMTTLPTTFDPRKAFAFASRASAVVVVAGVLAGHLLTVLYWHLAAWLRSIKTVIDLARDGGGVVTILRALFLGQVPARRFAK
jgi:hypothetical protein